MGFNITGEEVEEADQVEAFWRRPHNRAEKLETEFIIHKDLLSKSKEYMRKGPEI
jgi:hypothetical protein